MKKAIITYIISIILIVASFIIPPTGVIDNSVLVACGIILGGYQILFGASIKEITIDKNGVHIETYETFK